MKHESALCGADSLPLLKYTGDLGCDGISELKALR